MSGGARVTLVEIADTLEPPAVHGPVLVDGAAVVVTEKDTSAVPIRQDAFNNRALPIVDPHIHRERPESPSLVPFQQHGVIVPVLLAAGRVAEMAWALAKDGEAVSH